MPELVPVTTACGVAPWFGASVIPYRKGKQSGIWLVRWRNHHEGGNYKQAQVGVANDINDKPADGILTFEQAV
jgi:hypothetical protein